MLARSHLAQSAGCYRSPLGSRLYGALLQHAKQQGWDAYKRYGAKHRSSADDEERELFIGCHEPEAPPLDRRRRSRHCNGARRRVHPAGAKVLCKARLADPALHSPRKIRGDRKVAKTKFAGALRSCGRRVGTPVVFIFDQFEQYFIGQDFGANVEDHEFEADLARIVKRRDLGVHVLVSIPGGCAA